MQEYSIGAVSRLTQIPTHTLRKWESRHGIAVPQRSETGRRVYSEKDVEQLRLIKLLTDAGHALRHIAPLSIEELNELSQQGQTSILSEPTEDLILVGPRVSRLLLNSGAVKHRHADTLDDWLKDQTGFTTTSETLVTETPTLSANILDVLETLSERVAKVIVVYSFGSKSAVARARQGSVIAVPGPVQEHDLLSLIETGATEHGVSDDPRFSTQELIRIANLNPGLLCECPNHIAKLLIDISAFEQYSKDCVDDDPRERTLHKQLADISAQSRALFETALIAVASADGLQLNHTD